MFSCILMARVCKLVSLLFCRGLSVHPLHLHKSVSLLNPRPAAAPPLRPLPHPLFLAQHPLPPAPGAAASPGIEVCSNIRLPGALIYLGGGGSAWAFPLFKKQWKFSLENKHPSSERQMGDLLGQDTTDPSLLLNLAWLSFGLLKQESLFGQAQHPRALGLPFLTSLQPDCKPSVCGKI